MIELKELRGEVLPYEKQLIPQYEEIKLEFKEALEDHGAGEYTGVDPKQAAFTVATKVDTDDVSRSTTKGQSD